MSKMTQHRKPVLLITLSLLFTAIAVFMACRKTNQNEPRTAADGLPVVFNAAVAKEWFYGVFKKSKEFTDVPVALDGKKLPDWKTGRYKKAGNMEIVEFDLVAQKKKALLSPATPRADNNRIAEATINRAVFVRQGNSVKLELVQYIPEMNYLAGNGYDISKNTLVTPDNSFTGKILITRWDGIFIKGYKMENGRKTRAISLLQNKFKPSGETPALNTPINPDCYYSYYAWFEQDCTTTELGDGMSIEVCGDWNMVWDYVEETSCPISQSECETLGLSTEDCLCQTVGLCNGDESGSGCANTQEQVDAIAATHEVDNTLIEHTSSPLPNNQWEELYKWQIYKVAWPCTKKIYSNEKAILKFNGTTVPTLPSNEKIFHSFTHGNLSSSGFTIGYGLSWEESNHYLRLEHKEAFLKIWFDVTTEIGCGGSPVAITTPDNLASRYFYP